MQEVCQWQIFNATCGTNKMVVITSATYGRMKLGRCLRKGYGVIGCSADVTKYVDTQCSGRPQCQLNVADIALQGIRPCSEELISYMEVAYTCITGRRIMLLSSKQKTGQTLRII